MDHQDIDHTGLPGVGTPTEITDIPTADTTTSKRLAPDGAGGVEWVAGSSSPTASAAKAAVATDESTTSGSMTDLTTPGPAVTVTTGTLALVIVSCRAYATGASYPRMGFAVSGATTTAATETRSIGPGETSSDDAQSGVFLASLTAGSNTFTAKYMSLGGTVHFKNREITVIPLN